MAFTYPAIEERRKDLGISPQKIADKLGVSRQTVVNKLNGTHEFTITEVRIIAEWWGNSIDELVSDPQDKNCP